MKVTRIDATWSRQGMSSEPGVAATTTVCGLAAATAATRASPLSVSPSVVRSLGSPVSVATKTIATSAAAASAAAALTFVPSS